MITIRLFQSADAAAVSALNRAWLEAYHLLEPADEPFLDDPAADVVASGGAIFVAAEDDDVLGSVAMLPIGAGLFELAKLAVAPRAQGRGVGSRLLDTALDYARARKAHRVALVSNSQLTSALRLYRRAGFEHRPLPEDLPYDTADIYMELNLVPTPDVPMPLAEDPSLAPTASARPLMILIAGPYRSGTGDDAALMHANVEAMEAFALPLFRAGHIPIVGEWLALPLVALAGSTRVGDAAFDEVFHPIAVRLVARCDAVLRVGGASAGADEMVRVAAASGRAVYHRLEDVPGCERA